LIAHHGGRAETTSIWHDLALYQTEERRYVATVIAWVKFMRSPEFQNPGVGDSEAQCFPVRCHAHLRETLYEAVHMFETHDPSDDASSSLVTSDWRTGNVAQVAPLNAIQGPLIQLLHKDIVTRYRIGVGAYLSQLANHAL
jgi:hypothetical protein